MNNNSSGGGRFSNHFIRDLACSFIASKSNINFTYGPYREQIEDLGITLFTSSGSEVKRQDGIVLNDGNFFQYISTPIESNFSLENSFCQTKDFSNYIYEYLRMPEIKEKIMNKNNYNDMYNNNKDVFIHVRLGDVIELEKENHPFEYYDNILNNMNFENGYISSDSIDNEICNKLIEKYNLLKYEDNEVNTIMFGSTCNNIILSGGTFSLLIGMFGFYSNVYYKTCTRAWYPHDIYDIPCWKRQE